MIGGAWRIAHGAVKPLNITSRNVVDAFMAHRRKNMIAQVGLVRSDAARFLFDYGVVCNIAFGKIPDCRTFAFCFFLFQRITSCRHIKEPFARLFAGVLQCDNTMPAEDGPFLHTRLITISQDI